MLYRFYCIRCSETSQYYLGKTKQKLPKRFGNHISSKDCTSRIITQYKSCVIILLEEVECTKKESVAIERAYIETYVCVNKQLPGRTQKEYDKDKKVLKKRKEYCKLKKVKIAETTKKYRQLKKVEISKQRKEYRELKRNEILEKKKEKYTCECGKISNYDHKARHERSQFHKNFCLNK